MLIGYEIKRLREAREMSQAHLAQKAGIPRSQLCRLEKSPKGNPEWETVMRLLRAMNVKVRFSPE